MRQRRIPVRAETRVVRQPKHAPAWELERARLINRHQGTIYEMDVRRRVDVDMARRNGHENALNQMAETMMAEAEFRKYLFRSMADEMGRRAGSSIDDWMRDKFDPVVEQQRKARDHLISSSEITARFADNRISDEMVVFVKVIFPEKEFHLAQVVPEQVSP